MNPEDAKIITLHNDVLQVKICTLGARLLSVKHEGKESLYGPKTIGDLISDECYCGAICGRVANRIAKGEAFVDEEAYQLPINNGPNHLHGGVAAFSSKIWTIENQEANILHLSYQSPDGEEGYPGNLSVHAYYVLEENCLELHLQASTDAPTIINLTNHAYWNLSAEDTIANHRLSIAASAYTPMVDNIPTGDILRTQDTIYDFLSDSVRLGDMIGEGKALPLGYDDNFALSTDDELKPAAYLECGKRSMTMLTDAPGMQLYTGYYLPEPFGGVALEAQSFPDAPHQPHFPTIQLSPEQDYHRSIIWIFEQQS